MKLPTFKAPTTTQVPGTPTGTRWLDTYSEQRDAQIRTLTQALQRRIDSHNLNAELRDISVADDVEFKLVTPIRGVLFVAVLSAALDDYWHLSYHMLDTETVSINIAFDSGPTGLVDVTLLILGL